MSKYTEGPWTFGEINELCEDVEINSTADVSDPYICIMSLGHGEEEDSLIISNARLISQAPTMHKELEKVLTGLIDYPAIQKILDKVEGEV